jgi:hypothetical protein
MRSSVKIILIIALVSCAAIGLRHAQGQNNYTSNQRGTEAMTATITNRPLKDSEIRVRDGSFVLKNLTLTKMSGSTILRGKVLNKTGRKYERVSFEVRAYGPDGQLLKGLESKTIFAAQELKANTSVPINHGYGVWLQGVRAEEIARIEIFESGTGLGSSGLAEAIPLASHALDLQRYAEIEE